MSQGYQAPASTVILCEAEPSLRRLIALGLQHQGLRVIELTSLTILSATDIEGADLLVLDIDNEFACDWPLLDLVRQHAQLATLPAIVLSWESVPDAVPQPALAHATQSSPPATTDFTFLAKPFDARAMQQQITLLLSRRVEEKNEALAQAEAALLATYERQSSPSIWPVFTAAGLLLAVIGLMLQFALTIFGLLVVALCLLLWTLGSRTSQNGGRVMALSVAKQ